MDYKSAGVDIEKGNVFIDKIKGFVGETYTDRVESGVGGFAALYKMDEDRLLAAGTDGVGTKLVLAHELDLHDTIGVDLVGMCVNDVICTGARPLFFLDYLATGKLDLNIHTQIIKGIASACRESGCALIGGETAEMPGVYGEGVYDLAGFCVGEVNRSDLLGGARVKAGDHLIGLQSSGFHSNGYSLVRKLVQADEIDLKRELLTPTKLYVKLAMRLLKSQFENIHGFAHITGGGIENIPRMNEALGFELTNLPSDSFRSEAMNTIIKRSGLSKSDLYQTFNMGVGFVIACADPDRLVSELQGEKTLYLGRVSDQFKGLKVASGL